MYIHFTFSLVKEVLLLFWNGADYVSILCYVTFGNKIIFCVTGLYFIASVLVILWFTHGMQLFDDEMVNE